MIHPLLYWAIGADIGAPRATARYPSTVRARQQYWEWICTRALMKMIIKFVRAKVTLRCDRRILLLIVTVFAVTMAVAIRLQTLQIPSKFTKANVENLRWEIIDRRDLSLSEVEAAIGTATRTGNGREPDHVWAHGFPWAEWHENGWEFGLAFTPDGPIIVPMHRVSEEGLLVRIRRWFDF